MILVALLSGTANDALVARLASALGVAPYDARMTVAPGFPAIVQTTGDAARAAAIVTALRAQGDDAIAIDGAAIVASEAMIALDHFVFEPAAVVVGQNALPYDDVLCLLRAIHRARLQTDQQVREQRFSAGRALLTGGLRNTTEVTRSVTESLETREPVVYVFRRGGETPWILRESAHYEGLGAALGRTRVENFATTVRILRERAPRAIYDERLSGPQRAPERSTLQKTGDRSTVASSSASGVDALAHLLALHLARDLEAHPYRR